MRYIRIIILILLLLAIGGCTSKLTSQGTGQEEAQNKPSQSQSIQENSEITPEPPVIDEENHFEIMESERIPGWKRLKAKVFLFELDGDTAHKGTENKMVEFSLDFPGSWDFNGYSVFNDSNNKKIAAFSPVILLKPGQEQSYLDYKPSTEYDDQLISKESLEINTCKGTKIVTKLPLESITKYPHIYSLSDGTHGFKLFIYPEVINKEDQELFDRIINTFKFE